MIKNLPIGTPTVGVRNIKSGISCKCGRKLDVSVKKNGKQLRIKQSRSNPTFKAPGINDSAQGELRKNIAGKGISHV